MSEKAQSLQRPLEFPAVLRAAPDPDGVGQSSSLSPPPPHSAPGFLGAPSPSAAAPPSAGFLPPPLPVGHGLTLLPRLTDDINTARSALANPLGGVRAKS